MIKKFLFTITILLYCVSSAYAQDIRGPFIIEEGDTSPSVSMPWKLIMDNGSVTNNGDGTVTHSIAGFGDTRYLKLDEILKDIVAGVGLSGGENDCLPGADADVTLTFDATELDALTWDAGSLASITWTWNLSAGDPSFVFGNDTITTGVNTWYFSDLGNMIVSVDSTDASNSELRLMRTGNADIDWRAQATADDLNFDSSADDGSSWTTRGAFSTSNFTLSDIDFRIKTDSKKAYFGGGDDSYFEYQDTLGLYCNPNAVTAGDIFAIDGHMGMRNGQELRFYDAGNSNYVGFEAPALAADQIWILPSADSAGFFKSDGGGNLSITTIDMSDDTNLTVTAPITLTDDDVGINVLKDIVTSSPLSGGENDVLPGADADLTISIADADDDGSTKGAASFDNTDFDAVGGNVTIVDDGHSHTTTSISGLDISDDTDLAVTAPITLTDDTVGIDVLKDLVTTSPLSGGTNDVFPGADADITIAIADADDDGATKGAASFDNTDFDATNGNVTIVDDGHLHTTTSISGLDISDDTNLTAGDHITLTDDDLDVDDDFLLNNGDVGTGVYDFGGTTSFEIHNAADVSGNTGEGMISWDSDDDKLYVGDGAAVLEIAGSVLTQEEVEDYAGALVANATGTHTAITITYQDATNDMDFVVSADISDNTNLVAGDHITLTDDTLSVTDDTIDGTELVDSPDLDADLYIESTFYIGHAGGAHAGEVMIGGNAPAAPFHINSAVNVLEYLQTTDSTGEGYAGIFFTSPTDGTGDYGLIAYLNAGYGNFRNNALEYLNFHHGGFQNWYVENASGVGYWMILDGDGQLGVNTFSPGYRIECNGTFQADDYYSGDETQGATATVSGLVFKDGLYTSGALADDFLLNDGDTGTGVYDFGGTTSFEITNAADVSGNTGEGMISWDSDDDKLYVGNGAAVQEIGGVVLTQEQVDDYVDALINDGDSVHTNITITYDDPNDAMDFVIDDVFILNTGDIGTGVYDFGGATSFEITNAADVSGNTGEGMISWDSDNDKLYMGNGVAVQEIGGTVLTQEQVDDYVDELINDGDSVHTRITITYDDADNAMDFVVDDMNDDQPDNDGEVPDDITISSSNVVSSAVGFDAIGAVDLDYGSADVTDHTFITDGTGTAEIVLPAGSIDGTEILDDTIDSADYAALSIDAEHLAADIIDETKIADDGVDSEHYNNDSIDDVHINWGSGATQVDTDDVPEGSTNLYQLTQEEVDDYVDALINDGDSVHTRITITYDDANNAMDFVVDDMNDDVPESGDFGNAGDLDADGTITDGNVVEADLKAVNAAVDEDILTYESTTGDFEWHTPSEIITAGDNLTWDGTTLDATSALTQEQVEDYAGGLVSNATGTHTGIDITYQDATGDMDFVFDATELDAVTWSDGASATITHTWNLSAGDPAFVFGNDTITTGVNTWHFSDTGDMEVAIYSTDANDAELSLMRTGNADIDWNMINADDFLIFKSSATDGAAWATRGYFSTSNFTVSGIDFRIKADSKKGYYGGGDDSYFEYQNALGLYCNPNAVTAGDIFAIDGHMGVRNGQEIRFYDAGNSNYVGFEAPALTGDTVYIWPATDGAGALTSDGGGNLSWGAAPGDDLGDHVMDQNLETNGNWISSDGDNEGIFVQADGDVGIKSSTEDARLHVYDDSNGARYALLVEATGTNTELISCENINGNTIFEIRQDDAANDDGFVRISDNAGTSTWQFSTFGDSFVNNSQKFGFQDTGPDALVEIAENGTTPFMISNGAAGDGNFVIVTTSGDIGVNDTTPSYKVDINGTLRAIDYYSGDGTQGITQSETGVTDFDIVIKDGLITSFTKNN